jgi:hypothetical protein
VIKDAASMDQLVATLSAAASWGFALHMNEPAPAKGTAAGAARACKGHASGSKASKDDTAAVAITRSAAAAAAAGGNVAWRWDVLGVAFSTADGCAFYVPLYTTGGRGSSKDIAIRPSISSSSNSRVLKQMWQGVRRIFSCQQHKSRGSGDTASKMGLKGVLQASQQLLQQENQQQQQQQGMVTSILGSYLRSRVPELAAAATRAATATAAAAVGTASDLPSATTAGNTATPMAPTAAAAAAGVASDTADDTWLSPAPVAVTFGLKAALQLLSDPPAASCLPGLVLQGSVVDVRVAAWLVSPESMVVAESTAPKDNTCK